MKMIRSVAAVVLSLPVWVLASCSMPSAPAPTVTVTQTVTASPEGPGPEPAPTVTVTVEAPTVPAEADSSRVDLFLQELRTIDWWLANDSSAQIARGRDTCAEIAEGLSEETLIENVQSRFPVPNYPSVSAEQARQIIAAADAHLC